jgi:hypothetical protein
MNNHPKMMFSPLCDLHHQPMRRVMLEEPASAGTQSFHQCERRDCTEEFASPSLRWFSAKSSPQNTLSSRAKIPVPHPFDSSLSKEWETKLDN